LALPAGIDEAEGVQIVAEIARRFDNLVEQRLLSGGS
jgi:hypothetical protein